MMQLKIGVNVGFCGGPVVLRTENVVLWLEPAVE
jgi:hypothetical protein